MQVNILEAKTDLSKLVKLIESGKEDCIIIARHGKPLVTMSPYRAQPASKRIGIAKGKIIPPADFDLDNEKIAAMFGGME